MLNPDCPNDPSIVQGPCEVQEGSDPFFLPESPPPNGSGFLFPYDSLEVFVSGFCLPDEPLKLRLTPTDLSSTPTFLNPTSNGEVVHPGKMSLHGLLPAFSHN